MNLDNFKSSMEKQIYTSLDELFDKATLSNKERQAYIRNKNYCKYWLLRSKSRYHKNSDQKNENFIKLLARVINHFESDLVTGGTRKKIKEMFGYKKRGVPSPIHKIEANEKIFRSKQNSKILENTYFELLILSFFVEKGFNVELINTGDKGKRIPEFIVNFNGYTLAIEAKNIDKDAIDNNIFGDSLKEGFDYKKTKPELSKGYEAIKEQIKKRYEDAIDKYKDIPSNENYIIFMSIYYNNKFIGTPAINYLNSLQTMWEKDGLENFVGLVVPEENQTFFIQNPNHKSNIPIELKKLGLTDFHTYVPS